MSKARQPAAETLNHIEKLLTKAHQKKTPPKPTAASPSPKPRSRSPLSKSPSRPNHTPAYYPLEKDYAHMQRTVRLVQQQLQTHHHFRVQNRHSYFLNSKNPRPPLYLRAQQMAKEKELWLEQRRRQQQKQREEEEQLLEQEQALAISTPSKTLTKHEAYELSEKLYREHYSKQSRNNERHMRRLQEELDQYQEKPMISGTSKEIFRLYTQKHELEGDVFERLGPGSQARKHQKEEAQNRIFKKYYPFQPTISDNSRLINQLRSQRSKTSHCASCLQIKRDRSSANLRTTKRQSPQKGWAEESARVSHIADN